MSTSLVSTDSTETITPRSKPGDSQVDLISLYCPHPYLFQQMCKPTPKRATLTIGELLDDPRWQSPSTPSYEFRSMAISLLELWPGVAPAEQMGYASRLGPVLRHVFDRLLKRRFELRWSEVVQLREMGKVVVECSKRRAGPPPAPRPAPIPAPQPAPAGVNGSAGPTLADAMRRGLSRHFGLARQNTVRSRPTVRAGPSAYGTNESIQAWRSGM